jgi:hypothetical protein
MLQEAMRNSSMGIGLYVRALALDDGKAPVAANVQYFVECWRELRCRRR